MEVKRFLAELFDANFNRFIIVSTVKVLYVLGLVGTTAVTGAFVLVGLGAAAIVDEPAVRLLAPVLILTVAGGLFLLGALLSRLFCEAWIVVYRIAENTAHLVQQGEPRPSAVAPSATLPGAEEGLAVQAVA